MAGWNLNGDELFKNSTTPATVFSLLLNDDISQLLLSMRCSRNILARASCESPLPPMFNVGSKQRAVRSDNIFATPTCSRSCKSTLKLGGRGFCFSVSCFFSIVFVAKGCVHAVAKYCRPTVGFPMLLLLLLLLLCWMLFGNSFCATAVAIRRCTKPS